MFHHDALLEDNSSELFPDGVIGFDEAQGHEDGTALQQTPALAQQNQLLEKLQLQATANERLLKSALDEISSLRTEVLSLRKSSAVQTETSGSPS